MSLSDSMFLFEIVVEELKSFIDCDNFVIKSQFANIFTLNMKDPNELKAVLPRRPRKKKLKRKLKVRSANVISSKSSVKSTVHTGQSILFANSVDLLLLNMRQYPMELTLWDKANPDFLMGSTHIPWNYVYFDYLSRLNKKQDPPPAVVSGEYNVFDEYTSKRMATIKLNIKLTYMKDKITTQFRSLSEDNPQTFMYTGFNSKPATILSTVKETHEDIIETGIIKTIYSGGKKKFKSSRHKNKKRNSVIHRKETSDDEVDVDKADNNSTLNKSLVSFIKSDTELEKNKEVSLIKSKSCSSIDTNKYLNILNYIFGDDRQYGNQVYCVGYVTVEKDKSKSSVSSKVSIKDQSSEKSEESKKNYKFQICDGECASKNELGSRNDCSVDLPEEAAHLISITKCKDIKCTERERMISPDKRDDRILLNLANLKKDCCDITEKVEEVVGGVKAQLKIGDDPCFCSCECRFGFTKKTTYCNICGGYEKAGEEIARKPGYLMPYPCPIFHKLVDKSKLKTWSNSGSDSKKKPDDGKKQGEKLSEKRSGQDKSVESEKESKKGKKRKRDDRFKFNYGYEGIPPKIGHSQCAMPCTGTLGAVPKHMGWLWSADNVPGMKFRPSWKPGAVNKHVLRLLKIAKNPNEMISKKRRKDTGKKKRPLKRPLLVVHKKDGEYTVTMEPMKTFTKPRAPNQYPYEDKPVLTYTIGRTEEENRERQKKKERAQRRLERDQRAFIQSAFRDMCQEICVKTYQQALGVLPDTEDPECPCYPAEPGPEDTNLDLSCSCSEEKASIGSDTDSDEWIVEFTPPNATFDPTYKGKKVLKVDNSSQYTYLDYRVKLLDRFGNPVPRFFKGPDGKQQCSDLGGFWSPDHKWLEINVDGYVGPDGRWAPNSFLGPNGEHVDADTGKFQAMNGRWLVVGVDGYVDNQSKWRFYPKPRGVVQKKRPAAKKGAGDKKDVAKGPVYKPSQTTWSCFGDASPRELSRMGIVGHGQDKKALLIALQDMLAHGEDVRIPQPTTVPHFSSSKKHRKHAQGYDSRTYFLERYKCRHPIPSEKGIVAVDAHGNKTYFKLKDYKNVRASDRLAILTNQGISLSSFHVPCFTSFINAEVIKQQQHDRIMALSNKSVKCVSTQASHHH